MGKLIVLFCFALLAMTLVMAIAPAAPVANCAGKMCTSDAECCGMFACNLWANRCTGRPGGPWSGWKPAGPWGSRDPGASGVKWGPPPAQ